MITKSKAYSFSFTGAAFMFQDFMRLANYIHDHQIDVRHQIPNPGLIVSRSKKSTTKREFQELIKRYLSLTPTQRALLVELDVDAQRHLILLGICKTYPFIRDFIVEVVREKYLSLDYQLNDSDFLSFFNRKTDLHPELEGFAESTTKKGKQVTWHILAGAGLVNNTKDRIILPQFVNARIIDGVAAENPELLKIFLITDLEIKAYMT